MKLRLNFKGEKAFFQKHEIYLFYTKNGRGRKNVPYETPFFKSHWTIDCSEISKAAYGYYLFIYTIFFWE